MADKEEVVNTFNLPLYGAQQLLVPNVSVAELVQFTPPQENSETPEWHLGEVIWRDQAIPLLSFEAANGDELMKDEAEHMVVVNGLGSFPELKFYALLVQGIPHLGHFKSDDIVKLESETPLGLCTAMEVEVDGEKALIPDFDQIEALIDEAGLIN